MRAHELPRAGSRPQDQKGDVLERHAHIRNGSPSAVGHRGDAHSWAAAGGCHRDLHRRHRTGAADAALQGMRRAALAGRDASKPGAPACVHRMRSARGLVITVASWACAIVTLAPATSAQAAAPTVVPARTETATLDARHVVRAHPSLSAARTGTVDDSRPVTGQQTVLPVLRRLTDARHRTWLLVRLPGRAEGSVAPPALGWINATGTARSTTAWHIVVRRAARRVVVYRFGVVARSYRVVVGAPSTPTPAGSYFVEESVVMPRGSAGEPFALATSARSSVFQEFEGGPGQIALHGTAHLAGALGTAASHGCVRLDSSSIRWLAGHAAAGTPVTII
ncbi:MAG: ErfK/YbiS/YcfS/YnhG family protein [Thermoleophilia bacterium]|nr:ErfK/YbiS/YcfS/YnhG family protein [Thermoleophilia bacterium]